jgi:hypothetical protein
MKKIMKTTTTDHNNTENHKEKSTEIFHFIAAAAVCSK